MTEGFWLKDIYVDGKKLNWKEAGIETSSFKRYKGDDPQEHLTLRIKTKTRGENDDKKG